MRYTWDEFKEKKLEHEEKEEAKREWEEYQFQDDELDKTSTTASWSSSETTSTSSSSSSESETMSSESSSESSINYCMRHQWGYDTFSKSYHPKQVENQLIRYLSLRIAKLVLYYEESKKMLVFHSFLASIAMSIFVYVGIVIIGIMFFGMG